MPDLQYPGDALSRRQRATYVLILGALTTLGPFSVDLYLPAFPQVRHDLSVSSGAIQLTLAASTLGFALGQLIVGPLSDRLGRRQPLIIATAIHIAASLGVALAPGLGLLIAFRVLQGMGAAAGAVVALATVRDLFGGYPLIRMIARLSLVSGLAPVIAPLLGSQLLLVTSWRGIFVVLAVYGACLFGAAVFLIVETLPAEQRRKQESRTARELYRALLWDRTFVGVGIVGAMNVGGLFAYLSSSSFLFQEIDGFSPQAYGLLFAVNAIGIGVGVQTSSRLTKRVPPVRILGIATSILVLASLALVALARSGAGLPGTLVPLWVFITAYGFIVPCVQALALANHGREAGTAASLLGATNFAVAGLVTSAIGLFGHISAGAMGTSMTLTSAIGLAAFWLLVRTRSSSTPRVQS